jgi:hypothetical protein
LKHFVLARFKRKSKLIEEHIGFNKPAHQTSWLSITFKYANYIEETECLESLTENISFNDFFLFPAHL